MAEGSSTGHAYQKSRRGSRAARKPYLFQNNEDVDETPKIIIPKRPPRRPKVPKPSSDEVVQCNETIPVTQYNGFIYKSNEVSPTHSVENNQQVPPKTMSFEEIEDRMSSLRLSQESFDDDDITESTLSTPEKTVSKSAKKKLRRRAKKKNKNIDVFSENIESKSSDSAEGSTSTDENVQEVEIKREKDEKPKLYYTHRSTSKIHKNEQGTSQEVTCAQKKLEQKEKIAKKQKEMKQKKKRGKKVFNEHIPHDVVKRILAAQDPENPKTIEGYIRINPRCSQNAYVSLNNGEQDILIVGLKNRNRALEGDLVAVTINTKDKWYQMTENTCQKTGAVVSILEKFHPRKTVGFLQKQDVFVFLKPRDLRVPIMKINPKTVPRHFYDNPELFKETLFLCNIIDWKTVAFAEGEIQQIVGTKGDLSVETNAILLENDLVLEPYKNELLRDLPPPDYVPTASDIIEREDLRNYCIFTIDPATAVDLDDAMSCRKLKNGNYEVGVHIADVTHFLVAFSPLDKKVAERATTVYMVDNVYHMLPHQLCLACSLLPGKDKLAFSVILEMTPTADVVNRRFSKTVINSCCQMSYDQAQIMIDNEFYDWKSDNSLKIAGKYEPAHLVNVVRELHGLSTQLRKKRFDEGALRIDQPKLCVILDKETKLPISYFLDERKESNSLIEEFMLLANMTVAKHLYETLPNVSLLRSHAEPSMRLLAKTRDLLTKFGVLLDVDSAGALHNSLLMYQSIENDTGYNSEVAQYRMMVINNLCAKSMTRAVYKCSASVREKEHLRHYALNADYYTHFTSPIRRYPDCVVHRLLYASIKNHPLPSEWSSAICEKIASNCNTKKYSAKMAQEQSNALYFTYMLDLKGWMNSVAVVMDVKERSADAMLCDTGIKIRVYFTDTIEETTFEFAIEHEVPTVRLTWIERKITQVINTFSILHVKITKHPQLYRVQGIILPPVNMDVN